MHCCGSIIVGCGSIVGCKGPLACTTLVEASGMALAPNTEEEEEEEEEEAAVFGS